MKQICRHYTSSAEMEKQFSDQSSQCSENASADGESDMESDLPTTVKPNKFRSALKDHMLEPF